MSKIMHKDWLAQGTRLFGDKMQDWKFVCPQCKDVADAHDFRQALDAVGRPDEPSSNHVGVECIGRILGALKGPLEAWEGRGCNWAAYGLFRGPVTVEIDDGREIPVFRFAGEK